MRTYHAASYRVAFGRETPKYRVRYYAGGKEYVFEEAKLNIVIELSKHRREDPTFGRLSKQLRTRSSGLCVGIPD